MKLAALALVTLHTTAAHAGTCETERADLEKRCAANKLDACLALGVNHHVAAGTCYPRRDPAPLAAALRRLCDAGDGARCTQLADAHWSASGPRPHLGFSHETLGLRADPDRAIALYERGCRLDDELACEALLHAHAPREASTAVAARAAGANQRLSRIYLRHCADGASHAACHAVAERLRTGNGFVADHRLADVFAAHAKILEDAALAEFQRLHDGNW